MTEYRTLDKSFISIHFLIKNFDTVESFKSLDILYFTFL